MTSSGTSGEDASAALAYPQRPESLADQSAVVDYVTRYERAYRRNDLRTEHGSALRTVGLAVEGTRTYDAPEGAAIVRVRYTFYYEVGGPTETPVHADSPTTYASYYVDESVVLRAAASGLREDESALDPDPLAEGVPVECF